MAALRSWRDTRRRTRASAPYIRKMAGCPQHATGGWNRQKANMCALWMRTMWWLRVIWNGFAGQYKKAGFLLQFANRWILRRKRRSHSVTFRQKCLRWKHIKLKIIHFGMKMCVPGAFEEWWERIWFEIFDMTNRLLSEKMLYLWCRPCCGRKGTFVCPVHFMPITSGRIQRFIRATFHQNNTAK